MWLPWQQQKASVEISAIQVYVGNINLFAHLMIMEFYKLWDNTFHHIQLLTISNFLQNFHFVAMATRTCQKMPFQINKHNLLVACG